MVVRGVIGRAASATGALAATVALVAGLTPTTASAAPPAVGRAPAVVTDARISTAVQAPAALPQALGPATRRAPKGPPKPTAVQITGKFPGGKLTVRPQDGAERFNNLLGQVSWVATTAPQTKAPRVNKLGPKFTLVVFIKQGAQQTYDVYPLAAGGPRIYRPAKQPNLVNTKAGWFYGLLGMSEALRLAGVPLPEKRDPVSGGIGGGERMSRGERIDPAAGVSQFLTDLRLLVLLSGAVALTIALGLAGISFLIRRKV